MNKSGLSPYPPTIDSPPHDYHDHHIQNQTRIERRTGAAIKNNIKFD